MKEYIFVLGREPELSFLEVLSFFKSHNIEYKIIEHNEDIVIFLLRRDLNFDDIIKRLGGVIKIAEIFSKNNKYFKYFSSCNTNFAILKKYFCL